MGPANELEGNRRLLPHQLGTVCRSVKWVVDFGFKYRDLEDIDAIGADEVTYSTTTAARQEKLEKEIEELEGSPPFWNVVEDLVRRGFKSKTD